jgi:hypothetical protein
MNRKMKSFIKTEMVINERASQHTQIACMEIKNVKNFVVAIDRVCRADPDHANFFTKWSLALLISPSAG